MPGINSDVPSCKSERPPAHRRGAGRQVAREIEHPLFRLPYPPESYQSSAQAQGGRVRTALRESSAKYLLSWEHRGSGRQALAPGHTVSERPAWARSQASGAEVLHQLLTFSDGFPSGFGGPSLANIKPKDSRGGEGGSGLSSSLPFQLASTGDFW